MPSVGLRKKTTRVSRGVKRPDGTRLRSGRRLINDSADVKPKRSHDGGDWFNTMKSCRKNDRGNDGTGCKSSKITQELNSNTEMFNATKEYTKSSLGKRKKEKVDEVDSSKIVDKMYGIVYTKKRKRLRPEKPKRIEIQYYDKVYSRKRRKGNTGGAVVSSSRPVLSFVVNGYRSCWFASFFSSVLCYMRDSKLRLSLLSDFLASQPIGGVFSDHGARFLLDVPSESTGVCRIFGARQFIPSFSVDFSAVPFCFMYLHQSLHLSMNRELPFLVTKCTLLSENDESVPRGEEFCSDDEIVDPIAFNLRNNGMLHPSVRASKLAGRSYFPRSYRGIRKSRSLRRGRARNLLPFAAQKSNETLLSDLISSRKNGVPFSSVVSKHNKTRSSPLRNVTSKSSCKSATRLNVTSKASGKSATRLNVTSKSSGKSASKSNVTSKLTDKSSTRLQLKQDFNSVSCSANMLVIESDRCYREEGLRVKLELSSSRDWLLVGRKNGSTIYTHKALEVMRPCSCNRYTHALMWTVNDNSKLEFCNRQDWVVFKDLYKECSDRNLSSPNVAHIPVPVVREVSGYHDDKSTPFCRPLLYIKMNGDQISRALAKRTAIYDMDTEDEQWLEEFNIKFYAKDNDSHDYLSDDKFELMIDAFEKLLYCNSNAYSDNTKGSDLFPHLGKMEVVDAVFTYWKEKRMKRKATLLRVFQAPTGTKPPQIPKPPLRKKRSLKRQPSGRGKQSILLQAMAIEQNAVVAEDFDMVRAEANAHASACRFFSLAVEKRRLAQLLMGSADMFIYKAMTALQIAQVAPSVGSCQAAVDPILEIDLPDAF